MTKITEKIFDPQFGFFIETPDRALYPNMLSSLTSPNYQQLFEFFGMIVGKSLYEGNLLNAFFARFFLNKMVDKSN
jgi:HECT-domain (ubiquitin-transferase)